MSPWVANINASIFIPILVWSLIWKGLALWHAARRGEKIWYVALLLINTAGLLEIVYLLWIQKRTPSKKTLTR